MWMTQRHRLTQLRPETRMKYRAGVVHTLLSGLSWNANKKTESVEVSLTISMSLE